METNTYLPGLQPTFGDRLRSSKALIPTLAVLGVTAAALATVLVTSRIHAQSGGSAAEPPVAEAPANEAPRTQRLSAVQQRHAVAPSGTVAARESAAPCANCGVVESVATVRHEGQVNGVGNSGIGLGAIGGAVVGGILGNQLGGGHGRDATTVLGAAGGAHAGHQIEKNSKAYTSYQLRVRMGDGTVRTIDQSMSIAAGTRVMVEGNSVRVLQQAG